MNSRWKKTNSRYRNNLTAISKQ